MGPECNRFHHQIHQRNAIFLPMLCSRPSIKDVHGFSRCVDRSSPSCADPLSPRISCIGQVKRKNRVIGFPNPHRSSLNSLKSDNNSSNNKNYVVKYSKLKKLFSSKNLASNTTTPVAVTGDGARRRRAVAAATASGANGCSSSSSGSGCCRGVCNSSDKCVVSVVDLDPPLPVVKRPIQAQQGMEVVESLWKRRSGSVALKGLQIHHHHPFDQTPTTV